MFSDFYMICGRCIDVQKKGFINVKFAKFNARKKLKKMTFSQINAFSRFFRLFVGYQATIQKLGAGNFACKGAHKWTT